MDDFKKNLLAVVCDVYLRLESYASLFGEPLAEELVFFYKQHKKEENLTKFLSIVTQYGDIIIDLSQNIRSTIVIAILPSLQNIQLSLPKIWKIQIENLLKFCQILEFSVTC